jgi:hypothetical protein
MRKILTFDGFLNESILGNSLAFIFVPVDGDLKSLIPNLSTSKTPFPSEGIPPGAKGYLIVPVTVETSMIMPSRYLAIDYPGIKGRINFTKGPSDDGMIGMNSADASDELAKAFGGIFGGSQPKPRRSTGIASISAEVPGFSANLAFYLSTGGAYVLEMLMKKNGWDKEKVSDLVGKKIANGFPDNQCMNNMFWSLDDAMAGIKGMLAIASDSMGLEINYDEVDDSLNCEYVTDLLDLFKKSPGQFMSMNFSKSLFDRISDMVKSAETENPEALSKTIDNLSDLKSSGFFDD